MAQSHTHRPRVVLEGCNGDWAQRHYLPFLAGKAGKGEIDLWITDLGRPLLRTQEFLRKIGETDRYIDKSGGLGRYRTLTDIDYVFIVVPDRYHSEVAQFWLERSDRLAPEGKIFIEKPLDAFARSALKLWEFAQHRPNTVYGFDHYLARAYPFLRSASQYLGEIGRVMAIDFRILEPEEIPPHRVRALSKGIILDLFCHVLAVIGAVVERRTSPSVVSLSSVRLEEVKVAQYRDSPIPGETLAQIRFTIGQSNSQRIEVTSWIGKGVRDREKLMMIGGDRGRSIKLDFAADQAWLLGSREQRELTELYPNHVESFLEEALQGASPNSTPGVLEFEAALEILMISDEAKMRAGESSSYNAGESIVSGLI